MRYHPEDFVALSLTVEEEGGMLLADECLGRSYKLKLPAPAGDKKEWRTFHTTRCGMSALMDIPYDPTVQVRIKDEDDVFIIDHDGEQSKFVEEPGARPYQPTKKVPVEHMATVCAVDDAVGLWPRYAGVVSDRSTQRP